MVETVNAGPVRDFLLIVLPKTTNLNWDTGIRSHPENFLRCLLREGIFFLTHTYFYYMI